MDEPTTQAIIDHLRWLASLEDEKLTVSHSHALELVHGSRKDAFLEATNAIESGDVGKFAALVAGAKRAGLLEVPVGNPHHLP